MSVCKASEERAVADATRLRSEGLYGRQREHKDQWNDVLKLHHVQLAIPPGSEDECRRFYCAILGWKELPKPAVLVKRGGLWLSAGEVELHLGVEQDFHPAKKAHPAFLVTAIDNIAADLASQKFEVDWDDSIPEFKRFFVFDAVGNRLEFMQPSDRH